MPGAFPYIPGKHPLSAAAISGATKSGLLARYLPPVPDGVAASWLHQHLSPGAWVLDPFGASPRIAVEAARAGYRVLVAANNPVSRFLLEMAARPPLKSELKAALADLAASHKGGERIEPHIRSLYMTACAQCGEAVMAEAFLWERGAPGPFGCIYHCQSCGNSGEHPAAQEDTARAAHFAASGLHRARALERVAGLDDPDRAHVEEALAVYLPRAVYALFTVINKLESMPAGQRHLLAALLLAACDQANTLWPYPTARARPKQLTIPPRFRENNVWLALEVAVEQGSVESIPAIPLVTWPEQPPEGGISIFEGRLKDLGEGRKLDRINIGAILAALPRPNQAYWALSALWAGWLWGREAAAPFKSVLRRRRFDWAWHSTALHAALSSLAPLLQPGTPFLGLVGETEPGFLSAAITAAGMAGFQLEGMALRDGHDQAQLVWQRAAAKPAEKELPKLSDLITESGRNAGQAYLRERGEPANYIYLHAAALAKLDEPGILSHPSLTTPADTFTLVQNAFQQAFTYRGGFARYHGSEHSLEAGQWWLRAENGPPGRQKKSGEGDFLAAPLADRVEMALVQYLQKHPGCSLDELDSALCESFPGLFTPDLELVKVCLESYGEEITPGENRWQLRPQDSPQTRRADLAAMQELLVGTGGRLGYEVETGQPVIWREPGGEIRLVFYLLASAVLGKIVLTRSYPPEQSIIVCPGGRASLISYKIEANPRLKQEIEAGWRFLKFRHLRRLAESSQLNRDNITNQLALDPLTNATPQMQLL